jgi:translation initiation factor IF-1
MNRGHGGPGKGPGRAATRRMTRQQLKAEGKSNAAVDDFFRGRRPDLHTGVVKGKPMAGHFKVQLNTGEEITARIPGKAKLTRRQTRAETRTTIQDGKTVLVDGADIIAVLDSEQVRQLKLKRGNTVSRSRSSKKSNSPFVFETEEYKAKKLAEKIVAQKKGHKSAVLDAAKEELERRKKAAATAAAIEAQLKRESAPIAFQEIDIPQPDKKPKVVKFGFRNNSGV